MFILILTYKAPLEKVLELLDAHRCYLEKYYAIGNFLASGPQVPRKGGIILCQAKSKMALPCKHAESVVSVTTFSRSTTQRNRFWNLSMRKN